MGGIFSGRHRTKNQGSVEHALRLDMRDLRRHGALKPGGRLTSRISWESPFNASEVTITIDLTDRDSPSAILTLVTEGEPRRQEIKMEAMPMRLGGHRYFFICPVSGRRCVVLTGFNGWFASRQAHRLTYQTQSETPLRCANQARDKAQARALGSAPHPRPRGANRERLIQRWRARDDAAGRAYLVRVMGRAGHGTVF